MIADVRLKLLHHSILDTLSYAAVFGAGLTGKQLRNQLHTQSVWKDQEITQALRDLVAAKQIQKKGIWFLHSSLPVTLHELQERHQTTQRKISQAYEKIRLFSWLPSIEAIALTGSVAAGSAHPDDDIDLMIITKPNSLWITRLVVLGLLLPTGWLRRSQEHGQFKDLLCLNLWLTSEAFSMRQRTLYIAHEVMQATFVMDRRQSEQRFLRSNPWVRQFLAHGYAQRVFSHELHQAAETILSTAFTSMFLWCDGVAFTLQRWHMSGKQSREVVTREKAFFHPRDTNREIMHSYRKKRGRA